MHSLSKQIVGSRPSSAQTFLIASFFFLLAYDVLTICLSHAPRYGAGQFNVAHFSILDTLLPLPTPSRISFLYIGAGILSLIVAFGFIHRLAVLGITLCYSIAYFWSQADSYQHHYLIVLILILFCLFPVEQKQSKAKKIYPSSHLALTALYIQMSLIYGWTAVAKVDHAWLSGDTLSNLIYGPQRQTLLEWAQFFNLSEGEFFKMMGWGVMLGEFFAAVAFLFKPLRSVGFWIIPWFHIMVEWVGFDIELFSYYMLLINFALLSPEWIWNLIKIRKGERKEEIKAIGIDLESTLKIRLWLGIWGVCIGVGWMILRFIQDLPIEHLPQTHLFWTGGVVLIFSLTLYRDFLSPFTWIVYASRCLGLIGILIFLSVGGEYLKDTHFGFHYYRMWGGDLKRRGFPEKALETYKKANLHKKEGPARFYAQGQLEERLGYPQNALASYEEGAHRWSLEMKKRLQRLQIDPQNTQNLLDFQKGAKQFKRVYESFLKILQNSGYQDQYELISMLYQEEWSQIQNHLR